MGRAGYYVSRLGGHLGLGLSKYTHFKGRNGAGLESQRRVKEWLSGKASPPVSELRPILTRLNHLQERSSEFSYQLSRLTQVHRTLQPKARAQQRIARVVSCERGAVLADVEGLHPEALVLPRNGTPLSLKPGQPLAVRIAGYHPGLGLNGRYVVQKVD